MKPMTRGLLVLALAVTGCAHDQYSHFTSGQQGPPALEYGVSILVGLAPDARDEDVEYIDSGWRTTDAIIIALASYTDAAGAAEAPATREAYEEQAREAGQQYVIFPEILVWKNRNTRRYGIPDLLEVRLTLTDAGTGEVLDTTTIMGSSRTTISWNDQPQDMLPVPLEKYASRIFEGS